MTMSQPIRHRRLLSSTRRDGLQVTYQAAMGRTPRHAQSWADIHMRPAPGRMLKNAAIYGTFLWALAGMVFWVVAELAR